MVKKFDINRILLDIKALLKTKPTIKAGIRVISNPKSGHKVLFEEYARKLVLHKLKSKTYERFMRYYYENQTIQYIAQRDNLDEDFVQKQINQILIRLAKVFELLSQSTQKQAKEIVRFLTLPVSNTDIIADLLKMKITTKEEFDKIPKTTLDETIFSHKPYEDVKDFFDVLNDEYNTIQKTNDNNFDKYQKHFDYMTKELSIPIKKVRQTISEIRVDELLQQVIDSNLFPNETWIKTKVDSEKINRVAIVSFDDETKRRMKRIIIIENGIVSYKNKSLDTTADIEKIAKLMKQLEESVK